MPESYSPVIYNTNYIAIDKWQFYHAINFNNLNFSVFFSPSFFSFLKKTLERHSVMLY